jgi:hypothetical protein
LVIIDTKSIGNKRVSPTADNTKSAAPSGTVTKIAGGNMANGALILQEPNSSPLRCIPEYGLPNCECGGALETTVEQAAKLNKINKIEIICQGVCFIDYLLS